MAKRRTVPALLLSLILLGNPIAASSFHAGEGASAAADAADSGTDEKKDTAGQAAGEKTFAGIHFGVGITLTIRSEPEIESAEVVAGVVRITEEQTSIPRVMLETHFFFITQSKFFGKVTADRWGWGPFLGLQNGEQEIINAVATGVMFGFKRKPDPTDTESWNFGFGAVWDPKVKMLGDGIHENDPLPAGETEIRYKTTSTVGGVLVWSFTF